MSPTAFEDFLLAKHTTAAAIAAKAKVAKATLSGLASGDHGAALPTVVTIARAMNCQPATLFPELQNTPAARLPKEEPPAVVDEESAA